VVKLWRTRSTRDLSLGMWVLFWIGVSLWGIYGCLVQALPIILANGVTWLFAGTVLALKLRYK